MSKTEHLADAHPGKTKDPDESAPIRHCIILSLIGFAAIAVSIALPPDDNAPVPRAPRTSHPAAQNVMPAASVEPTASAFDFIPAQDAALQDKTNALPPVF